MGLQVAHDRSKAALASREALAEIKPIPVPEVA
jgi:hypothetical protein